MRPIHAIVIHCSASPNGKVVTPYDIDCWHARRGFQRRREFIKQQQAHLPHIGYHFVITLDGITTNGRMVEEVGAHVAGHNADSLGICLIGTDHFTVPQWAELRTLVQRLQAQFPDACVVGHRDLSPDTNNDGVIEKYEWLKTCPGFDVAAWIAGGMSPMDGHIWRNR